MSTDQISPNPVQGLISLIIFGGLIWFYFGGGLEQQVAQDMDRIHKQVVEDAIKQYEITKRSGTPIDAVVHAGLVSAAYLQAKDEPNYKKWKAIEEEERKRAGMR